MNVDEREHSRLLGRLSRLARRHQSRPIQFSLQSTMLAVGAFCIMVWLMQLLARNLSREIPLVAHLLLAHLCAIVIGGVFFTAGARWYVGGGLLGAVLASPYLLYLFVHDIKGFPFLTVWYATFAFALFANLGGAVCSFINERDGLAVAQFAVFATGVVTIIALVAA